MKSLRKTLLAILLGLASPLLAHGANNRGHLRLNLHQIALGIWNYYGVYKTFPTDIVDERGKPLLSWRVRLLPFIEMDNLYKQFKLNEPWDSAHNRELVSLIPSAYTTPYDLEDWRTGKTVVVVARGPNTFFGAGQSRKQEDIQNPLAIMLVGAEHAPIWTKPEDLPYDPADPTKGLGIRDEALRFVVLANRKICTIPDGTDPDLLRALFSIEEPVRLDLFWYEVLNRQPIGDLIKGCFFISLLFIGAGLIILCRLLLRRPTSPGEMVFLILGVQQVVFLVAFMVCYRYHLLPALYEGTENERELWAFPGLAAAFAAIIPVFWFRSFPVWLALFIFPLIWLPILAFESWRLHYDFLPMEALTTIGHPIFMALTGTLMAAISHGDQAKQAIGKRASWHWAGIAAAFVPLLWFLNWSSQGLVVPRELFMPRILD
jgi:hypothetical protein